MKGSLELNSRTLLGYFMCVTAAITLKQLFEYAYPEVFREYHYMGLRFDPSDMKRFEATMMTAFLSVITYRRELTPSSAGCAILMAMCLVPMLAYYGMADCSRVFMYGACLSYVAICVSSRISLPNLRISSRRVLDRNTPATVCFLIVGIAFTVASIKNGLPTLVAANLDDVYEVRAGFRSSRFLEYVQSWSTFVVAPFIIGYALERRSYWIGLAAVTLNVYFYFLSGGRYIFLLAILCVAIAVASRWVNLATFLSIIATSCIAAGMWASNIFASKYWMGIMFFRAFVVPAWLPTVYYDVFSVSGQRWGIESIGFLMQDPPIPSPIIVGDYLFANEGGSWASVGFLGDAYTNFGIPGMILMGVLVGMVFRVADAVFARDRSLPFLVAFATSSNGLVHAGALTVFASRGMFFCILLGYIAARSRRDTSWILPTVPPQASERESGS